MLKVLIKREVPGLLEEQRHSVGVRVRVLPGHGVGQDVDKAQRGVVGEDRRNVGMDVVHVNHDLEEKCCVGWLQNV